MLQLDQKCSTPSCTSPRDSLLSRYCGGCRESWKFYIKPSTISPPTKGYFSGDRLRARLRDGYRLMHASDEYGEVTVRGC